MGNIKNEIITIITKIPDGINVVERRTETFAERLSATRQEFYAAYKRGLYPREVFKVDRMEYESCIEADSANKPYYPTDIIYDGMNYQIIRAYSINHGHETELTCG